MRKMGMLVGLAALFIAGPSLASDAGPGYVTSILITPEGVVLFNVSGPRTAPPACQGSGLAQRWGFNGATPAGQVKLATILSAYSMHKTIGITGKATPDCAEWGDSETPLYISITD